MIQKNRRIDLIISRIRSLYFMNNESQIQINEKRMDFNLFAESREWIQILFDLNHDQPCTKFTSTIARQAPRNLLVSLLIKHQYCVGINRRMISLKKTHKVYNEIPDRNFIQKKSQVDTLLI